MRITANNYSNNDDNSTNNNYYYNHNNNYEYPDFYNTRFDDHNYDC